MKPTFRSFSFVPFWLLLALGACLLGAGYAGRANVRIAAAAPAAAQEETAPAAVSRFIKENHPSPFTKVSEADFDAAIARLEQNWASLPPEEAHYALRALVASLGDEHTSLASSELALPTLPFRAISYDGHWMVVQAQQEYAALVGQELVAVNGVPIPELKKRLLPLLSYETEEWAELLCLSEFLSMHSLQYIGAADRLDAVSVTVQDAQTGAQSTWEVNALPDGYDYGNSVFASPFPQTLMQSGYYYASLLDDGTLFIQYNTCADNPAMPMQEFAAALETQLLDTPPRKIIMDLRNNSGGNSRVIEPLLASLKRFQAAGSHLYALIGKSTFSSGTMGAADLQRLGACLVGEPAGGVFGFGEVKALALPDGSVLSCSTKDFSKNYPTRQVLPDVTVVQTVPDFLNGIDSAMEYVKSLD